MKMFRYPAVVAVLALTATAGRADEVLAKGDPPLTRSHADRKIDFWEWIFGQKLDDRQRADLRQLQAEEWGKKDAEWKSRWTHFLGTWRDATTADGAKGDQLRAGIRWAALESLSRTDSDAVGTWFLNTVGTPKPGGPVGASGRPASLTAIELELLLRRQAQFNMMMDVMNDAQKRHHETMMLIIRNMAPTPRDDRSNPNR